LVDRLRRDASSLVRGEILRQVSDGQTTVPRALIEGCASDDELRSRLIVVEILVAMDRPHGTFPTALKPRALDELDDELRAKVTDAWLDAGGAWELLASLAIDVPSDVKKTVEPLRSIGARGARFSWDSLRPFLERDPLVDAEIARLVDRPQDSSPFSWLLSVATSELEAAAGALDFETHERASAISAASDAASGRLAEATPQVDPSALSGDDRAHIARLISATEQSVEFDGEMALEDDGIDLNELPRSEQPEYYARKVEYLAALRNVLSGASDTGRSRRQSGTT
jgi:hypothetical protein